MRTFFLFPSGTAQKLFEALKKKYSKKRLKFKQVSHKSGSGRKDVEDAEEQLNDFGFMSWLDPYIRPRKSKSNLSSKDIEANDEDSDFESQKTVRSSSETKIHQMMMTMMQIVCFMKLHHRLEGW